MQLPIPGVGTEAGPQYATDVNSSLTLVDQHDHSTGKGVQITPAGININSQLSFNNQFITGLAGATFTVQGSTPSDSTIYRSGNNLYFVDGLGNNIQITANGAVAGTPGSISNLVPPASASYVSGSSTFVFQSGASIAANLDAGSLFLRNISPNSTYAIELSAPAALSSNYTITLPSLPSQTSIVTLDPSGNLGAAYAPDGTTLVVSGSNLSVGVISTANISNNAVTTPKISSDVHGLSLNQATSTFNTAGTFTWVAPAGVTRIIVEACGGGGEGGAIGSSSGAGANSTFNGVIVGAGANSASGLTGGTTTTTTSSPIVYPGGNGGSSFTSGTSSPLYLGGAGNDPYGGGGASDYGPAGAGGGNPAPAGSYGAGGGGANSDGGGGAGARKFYTVFSNITPGNSYTVVVGAGGNNGVAGAGMNGIVIIYY